MSRIVKITFTSTVVQHSEVEVELDDQFFVDGQPDIEAIQEDEDIRDTVFNYIELVDEFDPEWNAQIV